VDVSDEEPCQGRTCDSLRVEVVGEAHRIATEPKGPGEESERNHDNDETVAPRQGVAGAVVAEGGEEERTADLYQEDGDKAGQRRKPATPTTMADYDLDTEQHRDYPQYGPDEALVRNKDRTSRRIGGQDGSSDDTERCAEVGKRHPASPGRSVNPSFFPSRRSHGWRTRTDTGRRPAARLVPGGSACSTCVPDPDRWASTSWRPERPAPTGPEAVEGSTSDRSETGILEGSGDLVAVALSVFEEAEHAEIEESLEPLTASGGGVSRSHVGSASTSNLCGVLPAGNAACCVPRLDAPAGAPSLCGYCHRYRIDPTTRLERKGRVDPCRPGGSCLGIDTAVAFLSTGQSRSGGLS